MDRLGTEKIVHSFRIFLERHPESDVFAIDADNAFNSLCRLTALYEIMKAHPALLQEISGRNSFKYNHEQMFIERAAKESERLHRE